MLRERSLLPALFGACVLFRLTSLFVPILDDDEAWFSASARALHSPFDLYLRAPDNKPPGTAWFFWLFQGNPVLARAGLLVLIVAIALFLGHLAKRISEKAQWPTSLLFLICTAIPAPKLLAVTNEALMLVPLSLALGIWWLALQERRSPPAILSAASGALVASAFLIKQTALLFLLPLVFAQGFFFYKKRMPRTSAIAFALGLIVPLAIAVQLLHPAQVLFWNFTYAASVLTTARESLFSEGKEFFSSALIMGVGLAPLIWASVRTLRSKDKLDRVSEEARFFLVLWFVSGSLAVAAGWGIFLHYFLLLLPPLCLWAGASIGKKGLSYLIALYTACCLFLLIPYSTALWGTDLFYYTSIAAKIQTLTQPEEKVFIWGGNAIPLSLSHRDFTTRFVTSRFAAPPYATPELEKTFEQDFRASPPKLFVDLHERGDNRFRLPFDIYPWLGQDIATRYRKIEDPSLPWAIFYIRDERGSANNSLSSTIESSQRRLQERLQEKLRKDFASIFSSFSSGDMRAYFRLFKWLCSTGNWSVFSQWDALLRVWLSSPSVDRSVEELDRFLQQLLFSNQPLSQLQWPPSPNTETSAMSGDVIIEKTAAEFQGRGQDVPLALRSRAWWISLATVQLQPVAPAKQ
jgi:hypothetical protein